MGYKPKNFEAVLAKIQWLQQKWYSAADPSYHTQNIDKFPYKNRPGAIYLRAVFCLWLVVGRATDSASVGVT